MDKTAQTSDEFFRQGIRAWESAVEAGAKMHEECSKWMRQMFSEAGSLNEWYTKGQTAASEMVVKSQENVDEAIGLLNRNAESAVKLIQKVLDARQSDSSSEAQAKFVELWESALEVVLMNTQAMLQANNRVLTAWSDVAKRVNGDVADKVAEMATKTAEQAGRMARSATQRMKEMASQSSGNGV